MQNHTLWNATLHPIVPPGTSFTSIYGWLDELLSGDSSLQEDPSLKRWLGMPRTTLKELHDLADAGTEWNFRQDLETRVSGLQQTNITAHMTMLLRERRHDRPCDLQWLLELADTEKATELLLKILLSMEELASEELASNNYDICGRAFMIASALLADFDDVLETSDGTMDASELIFAHCSPRILQLRSSSTQSVVSQGGRVALLSSIFEYRRQFSWESLQQNLDTFSLVMERLSFCMNELSIASGYLKYMDPSSEANVCSRRTSPPVLGKWVLSTAPVRIDLAGGWSDTPPICYEFGGAVTGVAVLVDGRKPLSCRCRIIPGRTGVLLRSENRSSVDGSLISVVETPITNVADLSDFRDPLSDCALLKAALVCLRMITEEQIQSKANLQPLINKFCSQTGDVRLEIVTASILPQGSGMGTSSILAAAVLASIARCIGIGALEDDYLLHAVLMLEQLLTSGGGWQDQANGIIPGIKTVRSKSSTLPVAISVERLALNDSFKHQFENRMVLVFTGKTRLAKNILQDVLRRWSRSTTEVVATVARNVQLAAECNISVLNGDIDHLGRILLEYSKIKVQMAGEDSGAMPESCSVFISHLLERGTITGACLCGAGGGGFMAMVLSDGVGMSDVSAWLQCEGATCHDLLSFTLHTCKICDEGISTHVLDDEKITVGDFSLDW